MKNYLAVHWHIFWAALENTSWGPWLAAVALVVGVGAFLDEYYVGEGIRDAIRQHLIKCLQRLAYPRIILDLFVSEIKRMVVLTAVALVPGLLYVIDYALWKGGHHTIAIIIFSIEFLLIFPVFMLAAVPLIPFGLIALGRLLYLVAILTFLLVKLLILLVFKPAAEPKRSPFKFATGMVGIWLLAAKFALELSK
ncbi:MAG TPA: hypothetical protein VH640_31595 [Bryobacteraceae bacterium]|jgi:hypothetical protein